jgi:RNA polymerase sigma-70 factor (ECF subfamily)
MAEPRPLVERFEQNRARLRAIAYRMLSSLDEADDAVQQVWVQLSRSSADGVENLDAFLTTIVVRVCLNALRARRTRREEPMGAHVPDPLISRVDQVSPEDEVLLADSVGLALQVVLETLAPAERLAFVLHDMFDLTFDEIAPMAGRTTAATRQLASRARRRVREADVRAPEREPDRQREAVDAYFAAAHRGDFQALLAILDPDVVLRCDAGSARPDQSMVLRGSEPVARRALDTADPSVPKHPVLVNGAAGAVVMLHGQLVAVMGFTVSERRIVEIDAIIDPARLGAIDVTAIVG